MTSNTDWIVHAEIGQELESGDAARGASDE